MQQPHRICVATSAAAPLISRVLRLLLLLLRQAVAAGAAATYACAVPHATTASAGTPHGSAKLSLIPAVPAPVLTGAEAAVVRPAAPGAAAAATVCARRAPKIRASRWPACAQGTVCAAVAPIHARARRQAPQLVLAVRKIAPLAEPAFARVILRQSVISPGGPSVPVRGAARASVLSS